MSVLYHNIAVCRSVVQFEFVAASGHEVCCSLFQCDAVCCRGLQSESDASGGKGVCVAVCRSALQCIAVCCSALQSDAVGCNLRVMQVVGKECALQCVAARCSVARCSVLKCVAVC